MKNKIQGKRENKNRVHHQWSWQVDWMNPIELIAVFGTLAKKGILKTLVMVVIY